MKKLQMWFYVRKVKDLSLSLSQVNMSSDDI